MDLVSMLITFLVFTIVVVIVIYGAKWLMGTTGVPAEIQKIVLLVLGGIALIVFLVKFVKPWLAS